MENINNEKPLLSICIPIYNRQKYLDRMLNRFLEDKELFEDTIHLYISDNCSEEDLESCCKKYADLGLKLEYDRNSENIGSDGNFLKCFHAAKGKYLWLLGSDDIPVIGFVNKLLKVLEGTDYGLVYIDAKNDYPEEITEYIDPNMIMKKISYYITFMSANIINTKSIGCIELGRYKDTFLIQVPQFISAALSCPQNLYINWHDRFETDTDSANNGGYNFYIIFIVNFFKILDSFVQESKLNKETFDAIKKREFKEFISFYNHKLLIKKNNTLLKNDGAYRILWENYGHKPYAYWYTIRRELGCLIKRIITNHRGNGKTIKRVLIAFWKYHL